MSFRLPPQLPPPQIAWFDADGRPTPHAYPWLQAIDALVREHAFELTPVTVAQLPTDVTAGQRRFASDGRKAGEGAGSGTGVLAFYDGTDWIAVDTGATVAA